MSQSFIVQGGHTLSGSIQPQGAKNEVLQILSAVLLTSEPITIHNVPSIIDVDKMMALLKGLGVKIKKLSENSFQFQADDLDLDYLFSPLYFQDAQKHI